VATSPKICTLSELEQRLAPLRAAGKKIVQCHGVFDVMHPGHILHFKAAREFGDLLVVTVTPDRFVNKGPGRPVFNEMLRMETLAALQYVDFVGLNEWPTAVEAILRIKPQVYSKGKDYSDPSTDLTRKIYDEEAAVKKIGGEIRFTTTELYSSSTLANRFFSSYPQQTQEYLAEFKKKHTSADIIERLQKLSDVRAIVVGEAILDRYTYCNPLAKSPKEFIVASKFQSEESFAGGALATANHLANFCKNVTLVTALGPDPQEREFIQSKMKRNIDLEVIPTVRPTIVKQRFLDPNFLTKMFEIQYLDDSPFADGDTAVIQKVLDKRLSDAELIIVADFGHGMITDPIKDRLASAGKFIAVNTQTNSANLGYNPITKYKHVDFACIDEPELRMAARSKYEELRDVSRRMKKDLGATVLMVTWGKTGALMFPKDGTCHHAPSLAVNVIDRIGAGDAFYAVTAPCVYRDFAPEIVSFVGNCVGALKVEIVCNRQPVEPSALYKFIQHLLK
jgi:rfaE bifunctional protein nucleotidyltransferase chain/domain